MKPYYWQIFRRVHGEDSHDNLCMIDRQMLGAAPTAPRQVPYA